jgi:hypothetical protein
MKRSKNKNRENRREVFIRKYLEIGNASQAYREAGYKDGPGTRQSAQRLLTSAYVQVRILEERQKLLAALDVKVEDVVRRIRDIAFADIADMVALHYGACRYCYGVDHAYQWRTPREFRASLAEPSPECSEETATSPEGGYGYDLNLPPHPDCPECDGCGIPCVVLKDTRLLTDAERAVFAGVVTTRNGTYYRFYNQVEALKVLAVRLGFYTDSDDSQENALALALRELQSKGQIGRMQLNKGSLAD